MKKLTPDELVRPDIAKLSAYHVPDATGMIKLDAMENPFGWSDEIKQQWLQAVQQAELNRYPDPHAKQLVSTIRQAFDIPGKLEVMLGNGSDELIQIIIQAIAKPDATVLSVSPGFVMYDYISRFSRVNYAAVPLTEAFELDMPALTQQIEQQQPAVVFIAYPNNPTGNLFKRADVEKIIQISPGLVVIDEAYTAFASDSFMNDLVARQDQYPNLLVMRTVSKMGLAGLRLGYIAGAPEWINEFDKVRLPYNINVLTQVTAEFALRHRAMLDQQTEELKRQRQFVFEQLSQITGLSVYPSEANFILFRCPDGTGNQIFESLKQQGVLIKNLSAVPALADCLRVTIGSAEENSAFLNVLKQQ